jgi:uncharacterized protein
VAVVSGFNLTPVKSTAVARPRQIDLRVDGAVGDRRFLFARSDGTRPSGVSKAPLLAIRARWDRSNERLELAVPDGPVIVGDARPRGDPIEVGLFDRRVKTRRVDPVFDEAVAHVDPMLTLLRVEEPDYAGGRHRVSLVSAASVSAIGAAGGDPGLDPRRFRMLVEVDDVDAFEEDAWNGRLVRLGDAVVRIDRGIARCVMTTMDPDDGRVDFPTLDVLSKSRRFGDGLLLGVYAGVEAPGVVRVGDPVEVALNARS